MELIDPGERMLEEPTDAVGSMGGCMQALAWMPGVLGFVSRWEMMGQKKGKTGHHSVPWFLRPRMAKQVRNISQ